MRTFKQLGMIMPTAVGSGGSGGGTVQTATVEITSYSRSHLICVYFDGISTKTEPLVMDGTITVNPVIGSLLIIGQSGEGVDSWYVDTVGGEVLEVTYEYDYYFRPHSTLFIVSADGSISIDVEGGFEI